MNTVLLFSLIVIVGIIVIFISISPKVKLLREGDVILYKSSIASANNFAVQQGIEKLVLFDNVSSLTNNISYSNGYFTLQTGRYSLYMQVMQPNIVSSIKVRLVDESNETLYQYEQLPLFSQTTEISVMPNKKIAMLIAAPNADSVFNVFLGIDCVECP